MGVRIPQKPRFAARTVAWLSEERGRRRRPPYVFEADGMATVHYSPFLEDARFNAVHADMTAEWFVDLRVDTRWRMWLLTQFAHHCRELPGAFAEFGVYRAGCAYMILQTSALPPSKRLFLFDTFTGIPTEGLTDSERAEGLAGALGDTSVDYVLRRLGPWHPQISIIEGDVFETLGRTETGPLAFVHMDLNASRPTVAALEYAYPRLVSGAVIVFDDYGWRGLEAQREAVDEFLADRAEDVVAVPTGQGLLIKH
jgi:O-methyltransferase